jgi:hypothetical protein
MARRVSVQKIRQGSVNCVAKLKAVLLVKIGDSLQQNYCTNANCNHLKEFVRHVGELICSLDLAMSRQLSAAVRRTENNAFLVW